MKFADTAGRNFDEADCLGQSRSFDQHELTEHVMIRAGAQAPVVLEAIVGLRSPTGKKEAIEPILEWSHGPLLGFLLDRACRVRRFTSLIDQALVCFFPAQVLQGINISSLIPLNSSGHGIANAN